MAKRSSAEPWAAWVAEQREWVYVSAERNATIFQLNAVLPSRMAGPGIPGQRRSSPFRLTHDDRSHLDNAPCSVQHVQS